MTDQDTRRIGHVDHGKTTLTAAITFAATAPGATGRDLREAAGDVTLSVVSPESQERIREAAEQRGLNPDRIYFIGEAIVVDSDGGTDDEYNRAEREELILGRHRVDYVATQMDARPLKKQWEESMARYDAAFLVTEAFPVSPKGKQGKNKSTRRFPLPDRRPLK